MKPNLRLTWLRFSQVTMAGVVLIGVISGLSNRSVAQREPETASTLIGQCRAVNKRTPIYSKRNPISEVVLLLQKDNAVILSENGGANGMIGVRQPQNGYVHAPNLKMCPKTPTPKPIVGVCRKVVQPQGLAIRKTPDPGSATIGGIDVNQTITLVNPVESRQGRDGRIWVKVMKPIAGWISNGFVNQRYRNLGSCS